jgi:type I restriction enzyme S subunit
MKESKGFKETEIGLTPEDWEVVRLGEVAEITMGQSPPGDTYNTFGKGIPFLQGKAEFGNISPKHIKYTTKPLKIAKKGSVLISVRAPVGDVNIANMDYCIGRGLASLNLKNGKNEYLFYSLSYFKHLIEKESYGSVFKAINKENLARLKIPLPPLEEQKAIADILSTVQNAIEKTEKVIDATKQLKKSMMKHLFTYGAVAVDEIDKVKLKESEIGLIPEHWEVVRLENVMEGFTPNKKLKQSDYKAIGKFPVIDQGQEYVAGFYDDETMVFDKDLPVILFGDHTRIIKYVDFPFICGADGLKIIIPKENFYRKYFYYALLNLNIPSRGYNRHFKILKEKLIPLPPLDEQQKIANILTTIDQKIQAEEKKKEALQSLFKTLLQQLMTGKIRVRHPS